MIALERLVSRLREEVDNGGWDGRGSDPLHIAAANSIEALRVIISDREQELAELQTPPDEECWLKLVSYAQKCGDGPLLINRITAEYIRMRRVRDERQADKERLVKALCFASADLITAILEKEYDAYWFSRVVAIQDNIRVALDAEAKNECSHA